MAALLTTTDLSREFGGRVAVDGLSLEVCCGEVLALLGPNGAGKTTTFRMIAGLIAPARGTVAIAGVALTRQSADRLRPRVGLLTEAPGLWERLTVRANLLTYAALHGVPDPDRRVAQVMERVGVADRADDRAGALSKGLKQRVALARTLVHDPEVVLLDEPTAGLDPASARHVRDLIHDLRGEGRAVLVSTHNLGEAEELADRIAVLKTRLIACDTPQSLRRHRQTREVEIEIEGGATAWADVVSRTGGRLHQAGGERAVIALPVGVGVPDLVAGLVDAGARLRRVSPVERTLEDVYLDLVQGDE